MTRGQMARPLARFMAGLKQYPTEEELTKELGSWIRPEVAHRACRLKYRDGMSDEAVIHAGRAELVRKSIESWTRGGLLRKRPDGRYEPSPRFRWGYSEDFIGEIKDAEPEYYSLCKWMADQFENNPTLASTIGVGYRLVIREILRRCGVDIAKEPAPPKYRGKRSKLEA